MPAFEQDHQYLLELSNIFEPMIQYSFDHSFCAIDSEITNYKLWEEHINGPIPTKMIDCTPENWYTQHWFNCTSQQLSADLDGHEFREICDYSFEDDEIIYTEHFLDLY